MSSIHCRNFGPPPRRDSAILYIYSNTFYMLILVSSASSYLFFFLFSILLQKFNYDSNSFDCWEKTERWGIPPSTKQGPQSPITCWKLASDNNNGSHRINRQPQSNFSTSTQHATEGNISTDDHCKTLQPSYTSPTTTENTD